MRRHDRESSTRSKLRKPGHRAGLPSGRLRLAVLVAAVAAFFAVPVAQAVAEGLKVNLAGPGSGEVKTQFFYTDTSPRIECSYASPGPATGTCESPIGEFGFNALAAIPAPGSLFTGWTIEKGVAYEELTCHGQEEEKETAKTWSTEEPFAAGGFAGTEGACFIEPEEGGEAELTATFQPATPTLTIAKAGTGTGTVQCKVNGGGAEACTASYPNGKSIEVIATASAGSTFAGFSAGSGSASSCSTSPCAFTIEANSAVTATFNAQSSGGGGGGGTGGGGGGGGTGGGTTLGTATAAATATVKSGKAALKLSCSGGACQGTLQLTAKVKQGKKTKSLTIGKASFSLAAGASQTLQVKLSGPAKSELAKGKTLKAKVGGTGIAASTVKLKPAKKSHK